MAEYDWQLLINTEKQPTSEAVYEKDYRFNNSKFRICIYKECVCVHWFKKDAKDGWNRENSAGKRSFNDAVRKAYLLYSLCNGKGLEIKQYTIALAGKKIRGIKCSDSGDFPFIFSMMQNVDYDVDSKEYGDGYIFGNKQILDYIATSKWSDDHTDEKMIALYSYLQSQSRYYEVDRFLNLWTAINSTYCDICNAHRDMITQKVNAIPDEELANIKIQDNRNGKKKEVSLKREDIITAYTTGLKADGEQKELLAEIVEIEKNINRPSSGNSYADYKDKQNGLKELSERFVDFFSVFIHRHSLQDGRIQYSAEELFERVLTGKKDDDEFWTERRNTLYQELCDEAKKCKVSMYALLTFDFPYELRNHFIHGSEASLLAADYCQINKVACMNYFMDRFLLEYIPYLFDEKKVEEMVLLLHKPVCDRRQNGGNQPSDQKNRKVVKKMQETYLEVKWLKGETDDLCL